MRRKHQTIATACTIVVSVSAVFMGVWSAYQDYRHKRLEKLVMIDQYLHHTEFSEARGKVRQGEVEMKITTPEVRRVCLSFDFASMLVRQGAIDEDTFVEYWRPALVTLA